MLASLPRSRSVLEISYGCIGRSARQDSTASASGFARPLVAIPSTPFRLLVYEYQDRGTRCQALLLVGGMPVLPAACCARCVTISDTRRLALRPLAGPQMMRA